MELSPGDIFDAETDKVPENVTAELQRQNYFSRQCELVTESEDLVISTAEEFYSLKLAGDHAYLVRDYIKAVELYEKYLRNVFFKQLYLCYASTMVMGINFENGDPSLQERSCTMKRIDENLA